VLVRPITATSLGIERVSQDGLGKARARGRPSREDIPGQARREGGAHADEATNIAISSDKRWTERRVSPISERDITVIHETSHTVGLNIIPQTPIDGTFGFAGTGFGNHETYDDNPNFFKLTTSQALNNADKLAKFVYYQGNVKK
jgi:hypothetical protein